MQKRFSLVAMATLLVGLSVAQTASADDYCKELLANKIYLQQEIIKYREKMRTANTPNNREYFMDKFENAYSQHSFVDHEFTRTCR